MRPQDSAEAGTVEDRTPEDVGGRRDAVHRPSPDPAAERAHAPVVPGGPRPLRGLVQGVPGRGPVPRGDRRRGDARLPGPPRGQGDRGEGPGDGQEGEGRKPKPATINRRLSRRQEPDRVGRPQRLPRGGARPAAQPGPAPAGRSRASTRRGSGSSSRRSSGGTTTGRGRWS